MFYCFVMIQMHFRLWELEKVGKMIFEFLTEICEAERTYVCKKRLQIWLTVSAHYFLFTFFCDHLQGAKICIFDSILVGKWGMMLHIMCNMSKIPINIQGWVHRQINDGGRINITLAPHCVQLRGGTCTSLCSQGSLQKKGRNISLFLWGVGSSS